MGAVVAINAQMRQGVQPPLPLGTPHPLPQGLPPQPPLPGTARSNSRAEQPSPQTQDSKGQPSTSPCSSSSNLLSPVRGCLWQAGTGLALPRDPGRSARRRPSKDGQRREDASIITGPTTTHNRCNSSSSNRSSSRSSSSSSNSVSRELSNSSSSRPRDRSVIRLCWHSSSTRDSLPWAVTVARLAQEARSAQCCRRRRCTASRACGSSLGTEHISWYVFLYFPSLLNRPRLTERASRRLIVGRNSLRIEFRALLLSPSQENC
jgi:hypothetical protein